MTPVQAIRANCKECRGEVISRVLNCAINDCPLHPFRMGIIPHRRGIDEQKKEK